MTILPLTAADRDDWMPLWQAYLEFYESELSPLVTEDVFERIVAREGLHGAIARDENGSAVGIVHWLTHPSTWTLTGYCYLEDLYVAPEGRGAGIGRALIAHVADWARAEGCAKVYWLTQEGNTTARALYDRVAHASGFVHYELELD